MSKTISDINGAADVRMWADRVKILVCTLELGRAISPEEKEIFARWERECDAMYVEGMKPRSIADRIEELEKERDQLREQVKLLRDEVTRCRDWFETQAKVTSKGGPSSWDLMLLRAERDAADEVLAAVEAKE